MNFKVFLLIFALPIFLSKYPPIFTDISDISVKSKYRYIRNYRYFVPYLKYETKFQKKKKNTFVALIGSCDCCDLQE